MPPNDSFIDECIAAGHHRDLLDFLLSCLPDITIRTNTLKGCIEIYIPDYTAGLRPPSRSTKPNNDLNPFTQP